jgi:repressor LexA
LAIASLGKPDYRSPERMNFTPRQQEVLEFIRDEQQSKGITPSTREIQEHFGYASQTSVMDHLNALRKKGAILPSRGVARSIVLPESLQQRVQTIQIPIYGTIPAGMPSDSQQQTLECLNIDLDSIRIPKNAATFGLKVQGDSMTGAGILHGDYVIMEFKPPRSGDIVAALIDGETTLKRYLVQKGRPLLKAENAKYPDLIPAKELVIQGVMIALFRRLQR